MFALRTSILFYIVLPGLSFAPNFSRRKDRFHYLFNVPVCLSQQKQLSSDEINESITPLMNLASAHITSQALDTFVQLGVADIIGDEKLSIEEVSSIIGPNTNEDALTRIFRLLVSADILVHESDIETDLFSLSNTGALLQTMVDGQPSLASGVMHWMERPLWTSWLYLPEYIKGSLEKGNNLDPFERANGQSSDYYYNAKTEPRSLQHANDFVRFISDTEIEGIVTSLDWSQFAGKAILDVGGYNGKVLDAIDASTPDVNFKSMKCLDLPQVIEGIKQKHTNVELIAGDILDASTVPAADVILLKHFLDRCMWNEEETVMILTACHQKIPSDGQVIVAEAVIPDFGQAQETNRLEIALDALYMLVGRERQRTEKEWENLAYKSGFRIEEIIRTISASSSLIVLTKK